MALAVWSSESELCLGNRAFFHDLLVTSLYGAVPGEQGAAVAVLIAEQLDFQVSGSGGQLHPKDW